MPDAQADSPTTAPDPDGPRGGPDPSARDGSESRPHEQVVGDRALQEATGRPRTVWYALLDAAGATGWPHRDTAAWLVREHGVDGWWAQGITVGYEQSRGIRIPGQRQDGSFECSVSRTVPFDRERAYALVADADRRSAWLDVPVEVTGETPPASVRWALPDGTRAVVRVEPVRPGATRVVVQHARLLDADTLTASKRAWNDRLAALAALAALAPRDG